MSVDGFRETWLACSLRWKGTSLRWNTDVTIWNGTGEAEALCELFVDNLGSLLGTTGACVGTIGYGIVGNLPPFAGGYGTAIAEEWEKVYFSRNIPGCAFAMLLGNLFYAWQCGRLGSKEGRNDVTAQPYGINTTGVYITLFAIQLEAVERCSQEIESCLLTVCFDIRHRI